jgi:hypothetical protein
MNGGKIEISIAAVYSQFEADMKKAAAAAVPGGKAVGEAFGDGFSRGSTKYIDRATQDITKKLTAAVGVFSIVNSFSAALEEGAKGASIGESIVAGIKSVPVVGTLVTIGENLGQIIANKVTGQLEANAIVAQQKALTERNKLIVEQENKAREAAQALADEEQKLEDEARKATERSIQREYDLRRELEIRQLEEAGKYREALMLRSGLKQAQILRDMDEQIQRARSQEEGESIIRVAQQRIKNLDAETKFDLANKEKADAERISKAAAAEAAARIKAEQDVIDAAYEKLKENDSKVSAIMEERMSLGTATGSVGTSFGTFKFRAYTDTEKKANDKAMVNKLDAIAKSSQATVDELKRGGGGGFN